MRLHTYEESVDGKTAQGSEVGSLPIAATGPRCLPTSASTLDRYGFARRARRVLPERGVRSDIQLSLGLSRDLMAEHTCQQCSSDSAWDYVRPCRW